MTRYHVAIHHQRRLRIQKTATTSFAATSTTHSIAFSWLRWRCQRVTLSRDITELRNSAFLLLSSYFSQWLILLFTPGIFMVTVVKWYIFSRRFGKIWQVNKYVEALEILCADISTSAMLLRILCISYFASNIEDV